MPEEIQRKIDNSYLGDIIYFYRLFKGRLYCKWYSLYYSVVSPRNEIEQAYKDWGIAGFSPYSYIWKKNIINFSIKWNEILITVYHIFGTMESDFILDVTWNPILFAAYKSLLIEQDKRSAHRYIDSYENKG